MNDDLTYYATSLTSCVLNATAFTLVQQILGIIAGLTTIAYTIYKFVKEKQYGNN